MRYRKIQSVDYVVVHCAATKPSMDIGREEIEKWHRQRGFFSVGYHYIIRRDGTLEEGRPEYQPGAHARGYNHKSIGICLVGGIAEDGWEENNFTPEQFDALWDLLKELHTRYPTAHLKGHRDLPNVRKACPSFDVYEWYEAEFLKRGGPACFVSS